MSRLDTLALQPFLACSAGSRASCCVFGLAHSPSPLSMLASGKTPIDATSRFEVVTKRRAYHRRHVMLLKKTCANVFPCPYRTRCSHTHVILEASRSTCRRRVPQSGWTIIIGTKHSSIGMISRERAASRVTPETLRAFRFMYFLGPKIVMLHAVCCMPYVVWQCMLRLSGH